MPYFIIYNTIQTLTQYFLTEEIFYLMKKSQTKKNKPHAHADKQREIGHRTVSRKAT